MYISQTDLEIVQLRNAQLWNEQRLDTARNDQDISRYEKNIRDLSDAIYDLIRYDAINS